MSKAFSILFECFQQLREHFGIGLLCSKSLIENRIIVVVKKTFSDKNVFLLQSLMPPFLIPEHKYEKRYNL